MCFSSCVDSICDGRCVLSNFVFNYDFWYAFIALVIMAGSPPYLGGPPIWVTLCDSLCVCHFLFVICDECALSVAIMTSMLKVS